MCINKDKFSTLVIGGVEHGFSARNVYPFHSSTALMSVQTAERVGPRAQTVVEQNIFGTVRPPFHFVFLMLLTLL
jgi:hypothetical protein